MKRFIIWAIGFFFFVVAVDRDQRRDHPLVRVQTPVRGSRQLRR